MTIRMGKRADFEPRDVELLRAYAREVSTKENLTGDQLGRRMGISQQNANNFTKDNAVGGIGRITANALARSGGFRDAEELLVLLRSRAAMAEGDVGNVWHARDTARQIAEVMGVAPRAIEIVIEQRTTPADARRPVKWWVMTFTQQEVQMVADGEVLR